MQMWLVTLPPKARAFLRELQVLALLEFIPYEWILGEDIEKVSRDELEDAASEETGIDRFGSNSLIDGLGVVVIILVLMAILIVLLVVFRFLAGCFPMIQKLYIYLKKQMQYNGLLRFVL